VELSRQLLANAATKLLPERGIETGLADLECGNTVSHAEVVKWLKSWGTGTERQAPV
jgi:predicted transcriptional regulator